MCLLVQYISSMLHNGHAVNMAGSMTRTLQEVQNEKSEQQLEMYVCAVLRLCFCNL